MTEQNKMHAARLVTDTLISEIKQGIISEGAPLASERQLCERFGTSRPTIRAALIDMRSRGYVSLEAAHRPRATKPTVGNIFEATGESLKELLGETETNAHIDQVRQFIEVGAVRQAAQDASNLQIAQIHATLEQCFRALGDSTEFACADAMFHRSIVSVVQNPIILELHDRFVLELVSSRPTTNEQIARNQESYEEHRNIFEAISGNDPQTAMAVMDKHLSRSYRMRLAPPEKINPISQN